MGCRQHGQKHLAHELEVLSIEGQLLVPGQLSAGLSIMHLEQAAVSLFESRLPAHIKYPKASFCLWLYLHPGELGALLYECEVRLPTPMQLRTTWDLPAPSRQ